MSNRLANLPIDVENPRLPQPDVGLRDAQSAVEPTVGILGDEIWLRYVDGDRRVDVGLQVAQESSYGVTACTRPQIYAHELRSDVESETSTSMQVHPLYMNSSGSHFLHNPPYFQWLSARHQFFNETLEIT